MLQWMTRFFARHSATYMAGGMALQWLLGPLSDRIGRRPVLLTGALIFTLACFATLFTTSMEQFLAARFVQGTSICFIATVGYVTVQEAFGQTKAIKLMAIITSIVRDYCRHGVYRLAGAAAEYAGDRPARRRPLQRQRRAARFSRCLPQPRFSVRRRHALAQLYSTDELGCGLAGYPD